MPTVQLIQYLFYYSTYIYIILVNFLWTVNKYYNIKQFLTIEPIVKLSGSFFIIVYTACIY